ncbi:MAG: hypothetical protein WC769_09540 [Thermodesulfovibrionales bacterium]|jgi:hypothetical protein
MEKISNIQETEKKLLSELQKFVSRIYNLSDRPISSTGEGVATLRKIRQEVYEDLNQIMHESLILEGLKWLNADVLKDEKIEWFWNPRQTGDYREPDLRGVLNGEIVISAEASASEKPQGVIDSRMRDTLMKLNAMPGKKFYFARTDAMTQRARTKVLNNGLSIEVKKLS